MEKDTKSRRPSLLDQLGGPESLSKRLWSAPGEEGEEGSGDSSDSSCGSGDGEEESDEQEEEEDSSGSDDAPYESKPLFHWHAPK